MSSKKVLILYYSGSGNTKKMAKAIAEAMKSSAMSVTVEDVGKFDISLLPNYDSIVLGSPTYFSNVAWQIKKVIDGSIVHYRGGKLKGKVAGIFTSAGTSRDGVGDTEGGPKGNIVGQAGAGIGTDHCLGFPS